MDTPTAPKRRASEAPTTPGLPPGALGTVTALNGLPAALASIGIPTTPAAAKRPRVTDRQLPADLEPTVPESRLLTDLQEFERKLDATILRKRLELQEAKGGSYSVQRTLRMFISNTVAHQAHQVEEETPHDTQAPATPAVAADAAPSGFPAGSLADTLKKLDTAAITVPSWTLKIEGRLLELPYSKKTAAAYKFTSFFESVAVELIRDPAGYPGSASSGGEGSAASQQQQAAAEARESQITEWRRTEAQPDMDGFEIKRCGDVDVPLRIILTPRPLTNRFRLSVELARVLGFLDATGSGGSDAASGPAKRASAVTMTQLQVITHLWQYIRNHNLQSPVDPQRVVGDAALQKLLGAKEWSFPFVSHLLRPHLLPPEPIVIEYTVRVHPGDGGSQHTSPYVFDIQVEVDDLAKARTYGYHKSAVLHNQIAQVDEQLTAEIRTVQNCQQKRQFLTRFSRDPARFVHRWIEAQARELDAIAQDRSDLAEVARRANYFQDAWVEDAVLYYLGTQNALRP